jgi:putative SOS response-associated peptidase YedK
MCGRFAFYSPAEAAAALFGAETRTEFDASYNLAPTQSIPVVRVAEQGRELVALRWGLVPFWAKDLSIGNRMINARAETVAEKPSFRNAYRKRRCVVLADGFYEWRKEVDQKTPYFISASDGKPMGFAGLWEEWTDKETGESVQTATIVTTAANEFMKPLHQRMPVIVTPDDGGRWLEMDDTLLDDYPALTPPLKAWPVSRRVNNPRNNDESLVDAVGEAFAG